MGKAAYSPGVRAALSVRRSSANVTTASLAFVILWHSPVSERSNLASVGLMPFRIDEREDAHGTLKE